MEQKTLKENSRENSDILCDGNNKNITAEYINSTSLKWFNGTLL